MEKRGGRREVWREERAIILHGFDCWPLHVKQTLKLKYKPGGGSTLATHTHSHAHTHTHVHTHT